MGIIIYIFYREIRIFETWEIVVQEKQ